MMEFTEKKSMFEYIGKLNDRSSFDVKCFKNGIEEKSFIDIGRLSYLMEQLESLDCDSFSVEAHEVEDMDRQEMNRRQITDCGKDLSEKIPDAEEIMTVVYGDYKTVFLFDSTGLDEKKKRGLVNALIYTIQSGANYGRRILKQTGNVFFVY